MLPKHYIFNHIPKTAGNSLLAIFEQNLPAAEISPHLEDAEVRLTPAALFEHYRLVRGHFGILFQRGFSRSRYSITFLRDPIRRLFSTYTYWRTERYNVLTFKAKELPFAEFVRYFLDSPAIVHNPYTHHLAALGREHAAYPSDEIALLAAAKRNLAAYNFVGICEEFARSAALLCKELGWRAPAETPYRNRTSSEDRFDQIDQGTAELLRDRNRLDVQLYDYAVELFHAHEAGKRAPAEVNCYIPFQIPFAPKRRAAVESVSAGWPGDDTAQTLEISVDFTADLFAANLSLVVQVISPTGEFVWDCNTWREYLELVYEPGEPCHAVLLADCQLPCGTYFIHVGVSEPRRFGFYEHWIDRATSFTVTPARAARSRYKRGMLLLEFRSSGKGPPAASGS